MKLSKYVPLYPLSVFIFYLALIFLWGNNFIMSPEKIMEIIEVFHSKYGLIGIFISTLLEGIAYLGLYFPGGSIVTLFFIFSDGKLSTLIIMILILTLALTLSAIVNYCLGRFFYKKGNIKRNQSKKLDKSLFFTALHPDILAFYFFYRGLSKKSFYKVFQLPLILIPYGFIFAFLVSIFSSFLKEKVIGNPLVTFTAIGIWFVIAFTLKHKEDFLKGIHRIYKSLFA